MTDIPRRITPGDVVQISRILRKQKKSLEERGRDLVALRPTSIARVWMS